MDIQKYLSGMLNYNPNIDWAEEQEFDANGMPIPFSDKKVVGEPVAKSMPEPNNIAEQLKAAWLKGAKEFMGGSGMLNSKPKSMPELRPEQKQNQSIEVAPSEKPGWMLPRDADGNINGNYWSINTDDPYWDSEEGYQEALALYGESPAWSTRPVERDNTFTDFVAPKRISL